MHKLRALFVSAILAGNIAHSADLLSLYREAQTQDPAIAAARASLAAALEKVKQAEAVNGPSVNAQGNANYNALGTNVLSRPVHVNTERSYAVLNASVSASQPLYRKQNEVNIEQAQEAVKLAEITVKSAEQDLITRLAQAYFDVLLAQDNLSLITAQKAAVTEQLAQAKRNFEVGVATIVDSNEAQARYDLVLAAEISARNELERTRWALRSVIGRYEAVLAGLREPISLPDPNPNNMEAWVAKGEANAYAVLLAQKALSLLQYDLKRNQVANDFTVDAVASAGMNFFNGSTVNNFNGTTRTALIGVQVNYPLFTNGLIDARVRESLANIDKSRQDLETARRGVALATRSAFLGVTNGLASNSAQLQALASANTVLASTKLGLEVGVRTNLDILNAQQAVFSVRRDLAAARYNTLMGNLRLKAAVGELAEPDVQAVNAYLVK
ncbi:MAG: hypothetical protein RLZZ502_1566 [Pseudomonadota bacterium]